ncbi:MATE family efflux transporter [Chromobacterium sphagni]|uniref:Multidrug-efflux transporter n=1 Tax=Chromobacterium sphagni TaxID=1903179 RepID=A0A1S1X4L3_9NEIS|nr:MATE family efflux transporter [Chromobacterium sphagni]OHX14404.1 multidrug efflux MATE transporter NorM [Chromobacterium sphagni]OHX19411.1 multidrug efflux MATE transporter NorM [Chromobacterium sphagni]
MLFELNHASRADVVREARQIARLALPMMVAQIAQVATGFVDTVMAGRVSTDDLAAVSLGASVFITVYVTLMGMVAALNPILSHHLGSGRLREFGHDAAQGLWFGLLLGTLGALLMLCLEPALRHWLHLPPQVTDKVMLFITGAAIGMPAAMAHRALHAYASSLGHPKAIMVVSLLALALNIPLNYILIHGLFGLPKLGGAGCGWATGIVFWFNCLTLLAYVSWHRKFGQTRILAGLAAPDWQRFGAFFKLGLPIGLSFFVEVSLFSFIALLIAELGTVVVATHQSVLNFSSIIYMLPQSVATALSVRVGHHAGAADYQAARFTSGVGLMMGLCMAGAAMLLVLLLREPIMRMYSPDPRVVAMGTSLLLFAAVYQLTDAAQTIASGALRGYKLTTIPMLIHIASFWVVGLGLGIMLGLTDWIVPHMGVYGFWTALVISLSVAALLLTRYLARASRKRLRRDQGILL